MKKLSLYIFLVLMWCNVGFAECIKGDCDNGYGTATWADGSKYVGEHKDGMGHGQGTLTWADGDKYVGEWKDGKKDGQGTYTFADGAKYVGEFKDNKRHGQGTFTWADGSIEKGIWEYGELVKPN